MHVALTELVKNAYDADADEVSIAISEDGKNLPTVEIKDNGCGMTLDEIRQYWMKIGTTHKKEKPTSQKYGRPRTGEKGIGRFCCHRLGTVLKLSTCAEIPDGNLTLQDREQGNRFETTQLHFDWEQFSPGSDVFDIKVQGESKRHREGTTGTCLKISKPKSNEW